MRQQRLELSCSRLHLCRSRARRKARCLCKRALDVPERENGVGRPSAISIVCVRPLQLGDAA